MAEVATNWTSHVKGPSSRKHPRRTTLTPMFHSDRRRIPRLTPDTTDNVAATEMTAMSATCVRRPGSTPNSTLSPVAIWLAPRPREVAMPNTPPNTASRSTTSPIGP